MPITSFSNSSYIKASFIGINVVLKFSYFIRVSFPNLSVMTSSLCNNLNSNIGASASYFFSNASIVLNLFAFLLSQGSFKVPDGNAAPFLKYLLKLSF